MGDQDDHPPRIVFTPEELEEYMDLVEAAAVLMATRGPELSQPDLLEYLRLSRAINDTVGRLLVMQGVVPRPVGGGALRRRAAPRRPARRRAARR